MKKQSEYIAGIELGEVIYKEPKNSGMIKAIIGKNGTISFAPTDNEKEALTVKQIRKIFK